MPEPHEYADESKYDSVFSGKGGYTYGQNANGDYVIIKSPRSLGGQTVKRGTDVWQKIQAEREELAPKNGDTDVNKNKDVTSIENARKAAAKVGMVEEGKSQADRAVAKAQTAPNGTTPGTSIEFKPAADKIEVEKPAAKSKPEMVGGMPVTRRYEAAGDHVEETDYDENGQPIRTETQTATRRK